MIVADAGIVHHVLEIADDLRRGEVLAASRYQRLMHVQRDGKRAAEAAKINPAFRQIAWLSAVGLDRGVELLFRAANIREVVNVFRQMSFHVRQYRSSLIINSYRVGRKHVGR